MITWWFSQSFVNQGLGLHVNWIIIMVHLEWTRSGTMSCLIIWMVSSILCEHGIWTKNVTFDDFVTILSILNDHSIIRPRDQLYLNIVMVHWTLFMCNTTTSRIRKSWQYCCLIMAWSSLHASWRSFVNIAYIKILQIYNTSEHHDHKLVIPSCVNMAYYELHVQIYNTSDHDDHIDDSIFCKHGLLRITHLQNWYISTSWSLVIPSCVNMAY